MVECSFTEPAREDAWNRYYSGLKLDQVLAVPGFRSSQRFRAVDAARCPYLAIHTVESLAVFQGQSYKSGGGGSFGEWQPYIMDWRRSFFSGIDVAPDIGLDERIAVTDLPADQVAVANLPFLWLSSAGLDAAAPQRGIARITREQADALMAAPVSGIRIYAPMMARRLEPQGKGGRMSENKGFLIVSMEPPSAMEEEFNEWYDSEHLPERAGIPGFETALRFVCVAGWPRYLAVYDLQAAAILDQPAYLAVSGDRFSPWSKRVLKRVRGQYRAAGDQIYPGQAITGHCARMLLLRFHRAPASAEALIVSSTRAAFEGRPGVIQVRVFRHSSGEAFDYLALIEANARFAPDAVDARAFGEAAPWLDLINEYTPYWTRGHLPGVYTDAKA